MEAIDDFVPLGVVRRALRIFDEEMAKARARLGVEHPTTSPTLLAGHIQNGEKE